MAGSQVQAMQNRSQSSTAVGSAHVATTTAQAAGPAPEVEDVTGANVESKTSNNSKFSASKVLLMFAFGLFLT